ncbi:MAG TPA: ABC transporter ATPase [Bacteroidia bacterium]|nr:ABC transporter ATPase [Bacteroidia bacterium]
MPPHSRIWIYQSNRELTQAEEASILRQADGFMEEWTSHGSKMSAALEIRHHRFIIIALDEQTAPASGCGIDKSVRFIQNLEKEYGISLLNRMNVAWKDNERIQSATLTEFESLLKKGLLNGSVRVFNNLIETKELLESKWCVPASESWHSRLLS